jgi:hypothetical protein
MHPLTLIETALSKAADHLKNIAGHFRELLGHPFAPKPLQEALPALQAIVGHQQDALAGLHAAVAELQDHVQRLVSEAKPCPCERGEDGRPLPAVAAPAAPAVQDLGAGPSIETGEAQASAPASAEPSSTEPAAS